MMDKQLVLPGYEKIMADKPAYPDLPEMMQYLDDISESSPGSPVFSANRSAIMALSKAFGLEYLKASEVVQYWEKERGN
jgi:hypothetical protein